jgi:hypothetical protein
MMEKRDTPHYQLPESHKQAIMFVALQTYKKGQRDFDKTMGMGELEDYIKILTKEAEKLLNN